MILSCCFKEMFPEHGYTLAAICRLPAIELGYKAGQSALVELDNSLCEQRCFVFMYHVRWRKTTWKPALALQYIERQATCVLLIVACIRMVIALTASNI